MLGFCFSTDPPNLVMHGASPRKFMNKILIYLIDKSSHLLEKSLHVSDENENLLIMQFDVASQPSLVET